MLKKTYKTVICLFIIGVIFLIKDESIEAGKTTIVDMFIIPGEVDYNVSGHINLGSITGNIVDITITGTFNTGSFWAKDLSGVYYGGTRYWKISSSQMMGSKGSSIPVNTYYVVRPNNTSSVNFSGTTTSGANITSSSGRLDISNLGQQPIMTLSNNSGFLYRASITPSIAMTIPAGQQIDSYQAILTVTVPRSS